MSRYANIEAYILVASIVTQIFDTEGAILAEAARFDALLREAHSLIGFDSMALGHCFYEWTPLADRRVLECRLRLCCVICRRMLFW